MATRYAVANGAWESTSTWDGGAAIPASTDVVYANGHQVTINQTLTVKRLSNVNESPASASGFYFMIQPGATAITLTITDGLHVTDISGSVSNILEVLPGTGSVTINSDISGSSSGSEVGLIVDSGYTGTLTINGNVSASNADGLKVSSSTCTININGNITGASGDGIWLTTSAGVSGSTFILNITGDVAGGPGGNGIWCQGLVYRINVTGNVTGGSTQGIYGIGGWNAGAGSDTQVTVHGGVNGGSASGDAQGIYLDSNAATPGAALRFDGALKWTESAPVYVRSVRGGPMVIGAGTSATASFRDDSGWPTASGPFITIGGGSGPIVPTLGQLWPRGH